MSSRSRQSGFTLVETLVALAVMGFIVVALLSLIAQNTRFAAAMRDRELASIAADNLLVEALVLQSGLEIAEDEGEIEIAGQPFVWKRSVAGTGIEKILRIDISIDSADTGQTLAHAVAMRRVQ